MSQKYWKWISFSSLLLNTSTASAAADLQFFNKSIDYWNENKTEKIIESQKSSIKSPIAHKAPVESTQKEGSFPWERYLDPRNKDFFKEGDYTPPEPFMELARNPTDYNLKMWFSYIEKKNELSEHLYSRVQEYVLKNNLSQEGREILQAKFKQLPKSDPDFKRFRFRMYFDSHCPHCKQMFQTLSQLQERGFYVEARQVDTDPKGIVNLPIPAIRATKSEISEKAIQSVPLLLIGDLKRKLVYRMTGFQSVSSIFDQISKEDFYK